MHLPASFRASTTRLALVLSGLALPAVANAEEATAASGSAKTSVGDGSGANPKAEARSTPEAAGPFTGLGLSVGIGGVATLTSYQYSGVTGVFDAEAAHRARPPTS